MFQDKMKMKIFSQWEKHLKSKSKEEYRKILSFDEEMEKAATEFYSLLGTELMNHINLETMIHIAVDNRQKTMRKASAQKKTYGRVIKKGSSDFSDVDLSEFGL